MLATALGLAAAVACAATAGQSGDGGGVVRVATYNAALTRDGPGLLLHDLLSGRDKQALAAARVVAAARADVLVITRIDYDHGLVALSAFADLVAEAGLDYPHRFALRPNSGWQTGRDMVGDGRIGTPDDAQGWGRFAGAGGMAILSRWPIATAGVRDFSGFLWRDLPGAMLPMRDGQPFPSAGVFAHQRLASVGKWEVPVRLPWGETLRVLAFYASPPVFGGPEGRNALRNHDEVRFWNALLDGALPMPPPVPPFVLAGDANLDPLDGDGLHGAILGLLAHPAVQDPGPRSAGAIHAQGPRDRDHRGDPALDTTHWDSARLPGNLRVDYVLPSADLSVLDAGVLWPAPGAPLAAEAAAASRHRLVWVDLAMPAGTKQPDNPDGP